MALFFPIVRSPPSYPIRSVLFRPDFLSFRVCLLFLSAREHPVVFPDGRLHETGLTTCSLYLYTFSSSVETAV